MRAGFVGLGDMGLGMAQNLVRQGFEVTVRDVRPEAVSRLVAVGASSAPTCHDVGQRSEAAFVAVFDEKQVRDVCLGTDDDPGVIAGLPEGGVVVVHSTVSPTVHRALAEQGASRGIEVLDAAMTGGGGVAAQEGKLTFFVGGDAAVVERVRPALDAMAQNVFHVGQLGSGAVVKIINNFLAVSNLVLVREATRLARTMGIEGENLLAMISAGGVGSSWISNNWDRIRDQEEQYTTGKQGMVAMASKDMGLALELSSETSTPMPALRYLVDHIVPELNVTGLTGV
jgi:3-hydroxyisobutyrate dehydrogenase-like beta-hydroxyacid dehydrogenase